MQKRDLPPSSSGQPSQPKRPCFPPIDQAWNRLETNLVRSCCLTKEDVRAVVREELERAKPEWAEYFQSCLPNALKGVVPQMRSENNFQGLKEAVEPTNSQSSHLGRGNAKSTANNGARNLQLQLQTKLSLPLFTGKKIEGVKGAHIYVVLIDVNTGDAVTSGPESSNKLDVVVLEGDFNKDNQDNWAQEEFENHVVKQREGKRPLLTGDLLVTLKGGVGELGDLIFTDNSSWNRSKRFRIGLKVASGYCGNTRIQEAVTDAFRVKEHRGECRSFRVFLQCINLVHKHAYKKHYPPASDDEVWRLEKIAKDGKSLQKLSDAGIHKVEDFLMQLFTDPKKLKEILGKSITPTSWEILERHAMTCKTNWKRYLYYLDGTRKYGAVFDIDSQLIGLTKDRVYFAAHRLSAQEKEVGDEIEKNAWANWNDVREFSGETFSDSMQNNSSCSYSSQVVEILNPVQRYLAPIFAAPVDPEAPLANVGSTAEGLNGAMALALNAMFPPGYDGSTTAGLPTQSHGINLQNAMRSQMIDSSSPVGYTGYDNGLPSGPSYASMMEDSQSIDIDDLWEECVDDNPTYNVEFDNGFVRGTSRGVIGWLKIKAVLQWGFFNRKRGVRIVPLDEPPIEVQACS